LGINQPTKIFDSYYEYLRWYFTKINLFHPFLMDCFSPFVLGQLAGRDARRRGSSSSRRVQPGIPADGA